MITIYVKKQHGNYYIDVEGHADDERVCAYVSSAVSILRRALGGTERLGEGGSYSTVFVASGWPGTIAEAFADTMREAAEASDGHLELVE